MWEWLKVHLWEWFKVHRFQWWMRYPIAILLSAGIMFFAGWSAYNMWRIGLITHVILTTADLVLSYILVGGWMRWTEPDCYCDERDE